MKSGDCTSYFFVSADFRATFATTAPETDHPVTIFAESPPTGSMALAIYSVTGLVCWSQIQIL